MKIRRTREHLSLIISGVALILFLFVTFIGLMSFRASADAHEDDSQHFVTVFDNGEKITVRTSAMTVGEVIENLSLKISEYDTIEPGLDEEIMEDNFNINIYRSRSVVVSDGTEKRIIDTAETEPIEIAKAAGFTIQDEDIVEIVPYDDLLESGMMSIFQIKYAKVINLNFFGQKVQKRTQATTVAELIHNLKIEHVDQIWVSSPNEAPISDGMDLAIYQQGKQTVITEEILPFKETVTYDYSIKYGTRKVTKPGKNGQRIVTYEVEMKDGKEISRKKISELVTSEPVTQSVTIGRKVELPAGSHEDWMAAAGISSSDYGYVNYIINHESHWRYNAENSSSHAYGLCQALPGKKMASAGSDWKTNPITQLRWCSSYAKGRYGSWRGAYEAWIKQHWW